MRNIIISFIAGIIAVIPLKAYGYDICADTTISITRQFSTDLLPHPIYSINTKLVDLYYKTWELAWHRVKYKDGIPVSPYMDENLWDDTIWIWDTEFMVLFCRYAPDLFPGIQSLDNFYRILLDKEPSTLRIQHPDNPPFYSWVEWEYYKMTGDKDRLKHVLLDKKYLQRHYQWFDSIKAGAKLHFQHAPILLEKEKLGYRWGNIQSGMDNTPRVTDSIPQKDMLWMDALAQQSLSALYIKRIADELGEHEISCEYDSLYIVNKALLNKYYWDETDGFYYDLDIRDNKHIKMRTPTVYWAMLAEIPDSIQATKLAGYATDPMEFGGKYPWPTVSRSFAEYDNVVGDYWRGSIWLPTAYMGTKALEAYGFYNIADENAKKLLEQMYDTYANFEPHTIWECYKPAKAEPARRRKKGGILECCHEDFCGWSALGPISLFIENILGFHNIDASERLVEWDKKGEGRQGLENLRFGEIVTDIIANGAILTVKSNEEYSLRVNDKVYFIKVGYNTFHL